MAIGREQEDRGQDTLQQALLGDTIHEDLEMNGNILLYFIESAKELLPR
jgi:hypothetical protein